MNTQKPTMKELFTFHKIQRLACALFVGALLQTPALQAETVTIPIGEQGMDRHISKPSLGMSMDAVVTRFGEPANRQGPTGQPPITRWDYDQFAVYFEYDKVIHAVTRLKPKHEAE